MSFVPEVLDLTIKFTDADKNTVNWITGKGQLLRWRNCTGLTVYENGSVILVQTSRDEELLSGQKQLQPGIELYIVGGQVKEG